MSEPTHFKCDCVPNLGPPHCHGCSDHLGFPVEWESRECGYWKGFEDREEVEKYRRLR